MIKRSILVSSLVLLTALVAGAQVQQSVSVLHNIHSIRSQVLAEDRTVLVHVPASYRNDETSRFPVLYMLDAHAPQNGMIAGIVDQQEWSGMIPGMIIVGIQNTNRGRDLTPTQTEQRNTGGGDRFLDFIEKEVMPLVEKTYRTHPYRVFAGHSLGGLAVVNALVTKPHMFDGYIAASPHLQWDKDAVLKRVQDALKDNKVNGKVLFAGIGNEPDYTNSFKSLENMLKRSSAKDLRYELKQYPEENHGSVVLPIYYAGLRKVFEGWAPAEGGTVAQLEEHYKKLSKRYGYTILPPEDLMNRAGYTLLQAGRVDEAIDIFKKNVAAHPNSANTYDSLAEAYERSGKLSLAKENYERAYRMAESRGDTQLAQAARTNLTRVTEKLK